MRKVFGVVFAVFLSCSTFVSVSAHDIYGGSISWPPPNFELPRVSIDVVDAAKSFAGLFGTIRSIGNVGLIIMGIVVSVSIIGYFFRKFLLYEVYAYSEVDNLEYRRHVRKLDRQRNLDSIVEDRVGEMEVSYLAKKRFRLRHPGVDLEERIYQRELWYKAENAHWRMHPEREVVDPNTGEIHGG